jgi:hypothetical protein
MIEPARKRTKNSVKSSGPSFKIEEVWSEWQDLNLRPPRPERGALREIYGRLAQAHPNGDHVAAVAGAGSECDGIEQTHASKVACRTAQSRSAIHGVPRPAATAGMPIAKASNRLRRGRSICERMSGEAIDRRIGPKLPRPSCSPKSPTCQRQPGAPSNSTCPIANIAIHASMNRRRVRCSASTASSSSPTSVTMSPPSCSPMTQARPPRLSSPATPSACSSKMRSPIPDALSLCAKQLFGTGVAFVQPKCVHAGLKW